MNNLAIIPARGGSKRIPGKNIRNFCGRPVIAYSIEAAKNTGLFAEVMVSTDDQEIAAIAKTFGATVPFMRSAKNSDDFASTAAVLEEVVQFYEKQSRFFDHISCIYPVAPLISSELISNAYKKLHEHEHDSVMPVVRYSHPIQRGLTIHNGCLTYKFSEFAEYRTQDLEAVYFDAGMFYWIKTDVLKATHSLVTNKTAALVIDEIHAQDIDNESDWRLAEFKYQYFKVAKT